MDITVAQRLYDQLLPEDFDYDPEYDEYLREPNDCEKDDYLEGRK